VEALQRLKTPVRPTVPQVDSPRPRLRKIPPLTDREALHAWRGSGVDSARRNINQADQPRGTRVVQNDIPVSNTRSARFQNLHSKKKNSPDPSDDDDEDHHRDKNSRYNPNRGYGGNGNGNDDSPSGDDDPNDGDREDEDDNDNIPRRGSSKPYSLRNPQPRGITPRRDLTPGPVEYESKLLEKYQILINERVGISRSHIPEIKGIKATPPEKYSGKNDLAIFETWLHDILRFMRIHRVCGPELDEERVILTGSYLSDIAATWFFDNVKSPSREIHDWTFIEVIFGLYKRFMTESSAQKANDAYEKVKFIKSKVL